MKKTISLLALMALAGAAFAQDLKLAAGASVSAAATGNTYVADFGGGATVTDAMSASQLKIGAFFDATYVEASILYSTQLGKVKEEISSDPDGFPGNGSYEGDTQATALNFRVLGKLPFDVGGVVLFPVFGGEYSLNLNVKDKDLYSDEALADLAEFYLELGLGADFDVSDSIFIRTTVLGGLNLLSKSQVAELIYETIYGADLKDSGYILEAGLAVGFKL